MQKANRGRGSARDQLGTRDHADQGSSSSSHSSSLELPVRGRRSVVNVRTEQGEGDIAQEM